MFCEEYLESEAKFRLVVFEDIRWGKGVCSDSLGAKLGWLESGNISGEVGRSDDLGEELIVALGYVIGMSEEAGDT